MTISSRCFSRPAGAGIIKGNRPTGVAMLVRAILQQKGADVITIDGDATVGEAARSLAEARIGALVIATERHVQGILSERDIVRGLAERGLEILDVPVRTLMTTVVTTCSPDDSLETLMTTMTARRVRHLPVVESGRLAGIVSIGDVVKHRVEELQVEAKTLHDYIETGR
jgi:CBS domain-containing protein